MSNNTNLSKKSVFAALLLISASSRAATFTTLYDFTGKPGDGAQPMGDLVVAEGQLFGVTSAGGRGCGKNGCGTVFTVNPSTGAEQVLHQFDNNATKIANGIMPTFGLAAFGHRLIGLTSAGGAGNGTIFSVDPASGHVRTIGDFLSIGAASTSLTKYKSALYGATYNGGNNPSCPIAGGCGTVYRLDPKTGAVTIIYSFGGSADGTAPSGSLLLAGHLLYGSTEGGAQDDASTLFSVDPATGAHSVLYVFPPNPLKGEIPGGDLAYDRNAIYGTTAFGGDKTCKSQDCGVVYRFDLARMKFTVVHRFGIADGQRPMGGLLLSGGMLYGTAPYGGAAGCGDVFEVDPVSRAFTVVEDFSGTPSCSPWAGLVGDGSGTLYGTTRDSTGPGEGTVFALTP